MTDIYCAECEAEGRETVMVEDNGAGHLCPIHDAHPTAECGDEFPCSGFDGKPCALNS